jgi:carboxyl-terminal processing protease
MLPAVNRTIGKNIGFPDPCATPMVPSPVVLPYPNIADHGQAILFSLNVKISGSPALHMGSKIPITAGMEAGSAHPFLKQIGEFTAGNPMVRVNALPGICLLCPTTGNNKNNGLGAVLVPSLGVVLYTYANGAPGTPDGALSREDLESLSRELAGLDGAPNVARSMEAGVGRLSIRAFSADVPARAFAAVEALLREGMERLVIDLRDNPGGELTACAELLGDFLPAGTEMFTVLDGAGEETVFRSWNERPFSFEVTVLVNGATASAAELFAGVLARCGRAAVEGGPMFGKDTLQAIVARGDGAAARLTVGRWRPAGSTLDGAAAPLIPDRR